MRPGRPASEPRRTPGLSGATKSARPVASVVTWSPFEKLTVTPGVSRPPTSSTASVLRSPATIRRGRSKMRAADAAGAGGIRACCADDSNANTGAEAQKSRAKRSEEHTSELQSLAYLVCRLLLEKKKKKQK